MHWLKLPADTQVPKEVAVAKDVALKAALGTLDGSPSKFAKGLRTEYTAALKSGSNDGNNPGAIAEHNALRTTAVEASRRAIAKLRSDGEIGDDAFHEIEAALDKAAIYASRYEA